MNSTTRRFRLAIGFVLGLTTCSAASAAVEPASWPPRSAPSTADTSRLYFVSIDKQPVEEVASEVLGSMLQRSYAVAPDAKLTVSLQIQERLKPEELLARFESAVVEAGGVVSKTGEGISIHRKPTMAVKRSLARALPPKPGSARPHPLLSLWLLAAVWGSILATVLLAVMNRGRFLVAAPNRPHRHDDHPGVAAQIRKRG